MFRPKFEVHLPSSQTSPGDKSLSGPMMGPNESLARHVSWVVRWQADGAYGPLGRMGRHGKELDQPEA